MTEEQKFYNSISGVKKAEELVIQVDGTITGIIEYFLHYNCYGECKGCKSKTRKLACRLVQSLDLAEENDFFLVHRFICEKCFEKHPKWLWNNYIDLDKIKTGYGKIGQPNFCIIH